MIQNYILGLEVYGFGAQGVAAQGSSLGGV